MLKIVLSKYLYIYFCDFRNPGKWSGIILGAKVGGYIAGRVFGGLVGGPLGYLLGGLGGLTIGYTLDYILSIMTCPEVKYTKDEF